MPVFLVVSMFLCWWCENLFKIALIDVRKARLGWRKIYTMRSSWSVWNSRNNLFKCCACLTIYGFSLTIQSLHKSRSWSSRNDDGARRQWKNKKNKTWKRNQTFDWICKSEGVWYGKAWFIKRLLVVSCSYNFELNCLTFLQK